MPLTCAASTRSYKLCGPSIICKQLHKIQDQAAQLTSVIRKRRLQWFDHLQPMNMDRIPNKLYHWKPTHGKRRFGRPRHHGERSSRMTSTKWTCSGLQTRQRLQQGVDYVEASLQSGSQYSNARCCPVSKHLQQQSTWIILCTWITLEFTATHLPSKFRMYPSGSFKICFAFIGMSLAHIFTPIGGVLFVFLCLSGVSCIFSALRCYSLK